MEHIEGRDKRGTEAISGLGNRCGIPILSLWVKVAPLPLLPSSPLPVDLCGALTGLLGWCEESLHMLKGLVLLREGGLTPVR